MSTVYLALFKESTRARIELQADLLAELLPDGSLILLKNRFGGLAPVPGAQPILSMLRRQFDEHRFPDSEAPEDGRKPHRTPPASTQQTESSNHSPQCSEGSKGSSSQIQEESPDETPAGSD